MKLLVFMPAHNEEATIGNVIDKVTIVFQSEFIRKHFTETQIAVLNDNSTDSTVFIAESKGAKVFHIGGESKGVGRVLKKGVDYLLSLNPDISVGIDSDDQFDPNDIPRLVEPILTRRADVVTTTKFSDKKSPPVGLSKVKLQGNYMVTAIVNLLLGTKFTDVSSGFRAYSFDALCAMNTHGNVTYVQEAFLDFFYKGFTIVEVPIKAVYPKGRKSRVFRFGGGILTYGIRSLTILITALRDYNSLKFFSTLGHIALFVAAVLGGWFIWHYLYSQSFSPYLYVGFIASGFFFISLILYVVALLGDMLTRIRLNGERIIAALRAQKVRN